MELFNCINKNLLNGKIGVAVSGGGDSIALLHFLHTHKSDFAIEIVCINIEHGIRGENSKKDSKFVESFCKDYQIPYYLFVVDSLEKSDREKDSVENSARKLRYQCFLKAINEGYCDKIATAHHQSDNVESIFMHLLRGCSLTGAQGMSETIYEGKIIRPILKVNKDEIIEYINLNQLKFVEDETNQDTNYSRNFLRKLVMSNLKEKFQGYEENIVRFSNYAKDSNEFIINESKKLLTFENDKILVNLKDYQDKKVLIKQAIILALESLDSKEDVESVNIERALMLIDGENGKKIKINKNVYVYKEYENLSIKKENSIREKIFFNFGLGVYNLNDKILSITKVLERKTEKNCLFADLDKFKNAVIRNRQDGDIFKKFGGNSKKLKDYLIDKKVPQNIRDELLLICEGQEVLVIVGMEISEKVKVDKETVNIIKIKGEIKNA